MCSRASGRGRGRMRLPSRSALTDGAAMSMPSLLRGCSLVLLLPAAALAAPFAYVPNEGSGSVSVIDTATDQVIAEIPAGKKPRGTAVSVDGRTAYVSD